MTMPITTTECLRETGECPLPNTQFEPLTSGVGQTVDTDTLTGVLVLLACVVLAWVWWRWVEPALEQRARAKKRQPRPVEFRSRTIGRL